MYLCFSKTTWWQCTLLYAIRRQVHLELIKSTRSTNEAFGMQLLLSMTVSFVFITSLLYYAYSIFWTPNIPSEVLRQEMIPIVVWILFYSSKVLIINHMCAMASMEASKIFNELFYLFLVCFDKKHKLF